MRTFRKLLLPSLLISSLGLASCGKDFFDVNTDPNNPIVSTPALTLPAGVAAVGYTMGDRFQILGNFWAQHWTQSLVANQYKDLDKYQINQTTFDRQWLQLYSGALQDLNNVRTKAKGDSINYAAIAGLMQSYTFQVLTDAYDRIPYTQALQGLGNTAPAFDEGPVVYDGILRSIDESLAQISTAQGVVIPGTEDLIFQGDMAKWRRFGNTLKLKVYLRQYYAPGRRAQSEAGIRALYASGAQFLGATENATFGSTLAQANGVSTQVFPGVSFGSNPIYQSEFATGSGIGNNIIASSTLINYLIQTDDLGRADVLFTRPSGSTSHRGETQGRAGQVGAPATAATAYSRPNQSTVFRAAAPVVLMSGHESLFLQAEAALYGLATGANAKTLYNNAITASYTNLGGIGGTTLSMPTGFLTRTDINWDNATDQEGHLKLIMTQKWVALSGTQGFESWTEYRRTGYPSFITPSTTSVLPAGKIGNRVLYPISESQRNPNAPAVELPQVPVWWDTRGN